jgi:hypothetical protein
VENDLNSVFPTQVGNQSNWIQNRVRIDEQTFVFLRAVFPTQAGNQNILDLKNQVGIEKEKYFRMHCLSHAGGKPKKVFSKYCLTRAGGKLK